MDFLSKIAAPRTLALWGGLECTVNRVRDQYFSQLDRNGHATRIADLERFATLGIHAIRYPVLWERTAPNGIEEADWSWPDERLPALRDMGITPIVGFVHHGSGPRHTSLVDPGFAEGLAQYASAFAQRYPWVQYYTPVNEPLTTARFSGLSGVWYPHGRDERIFIQALLNQCRAVVLAMQAVRAVNPLARLVQTDDLSKTYSTPEMGELAAFFNERRWLGWDLLCGKVGPEHALWEYLTNTGIDAQELLWFRDHPCPPDIIGVNYYATSERWLDHRSERYSPRYRTSYGGRVHADIEAPARACHAHARHRSAAARNLGTLPPAGRRHRSAHRCQPRRPAALAAGDLGGSRPRTAGRCGHPRRHGVGPARLLRLELPGYRMQGLLRTRPLRCAQRAAAPHCPGQPDARTGQWPSAVESRAAGPRLVAPARALSGAPGTDPQRGGRSHGIPPQRQDQIPQAHFDHRCDRDLGAAIARLCDRRNLAYRIVRREEVDIADPVSVENAIQRYRPWAIINAAGYVRVDQAETDAARCFRNNTLAAKVLALAAMRHDLRFATFSSDLVFDGKRANPYVESDPPAPLNVYGQSKAAAEESVMSINPDAMVIRSSAFFGPWDDFNFVTQALRTLASGEQFDAVDDITVTPTYIPDLVNNCLDLLIDKEKGIWHMSNSTPVSWAEYAQMACETAGVPTDGLHPCPVAQTAHFARRPAYSALSSERACLLPPLDDALERYAIARQDHRVHVQAQYGGV